MGLLPGPPGESAWPLLCPVPSSLAGKGSGIAEAMDLYLLHFLLFAPLGELPEKLARGLSSHFPNLSLTREEEPEQFLAALAQRRWDLILLFTPPDEPFVARMEAALEATGGETPVIIFLPADNAEGERGTSRYPFLAQVATPRLDLFLDAIGRFLLTAQVREHAANLYRLMDFLDDGLFVLDLFGNILYVNKALASMQGGSAESLLGHNYAEFVPPPLLQRAHETFRQALGGRRIWSKVVVSQSPYRIFQLDIFPLRHRDTLGAIGGVLRDITATETERERERAYRRRRESQYIALTRLGTHPHLLSGDWEQAMSLLLSVARQTLKVEVAEFWTRTEEGEAQREPRFCLQCREGEGLPLGTTFRLPPEGETWAAFNKGRILAIEETEEGKVRFAPYASLLPPKSSWVAAPVIVRNTLVGLLICRHSSPRQWFADELSFIERLTAYLSQAYLAAELRRRNAILRQLTLAGRNLETAKTLDEVIDGVRNVASLMGFTWIALLKVRRTSEGEAVVPIDMVSRRWMGDHWEREMQPMHLRMGAAERALGTSTPFNERLWRATLPPLEKGGAPLPLFLTEAWRWEEHSAYLFLGGGPLPRRDPLDEETIHMLNVLADIVSASCDRIRFIRSLQVERERMELIHQLTQHLLESLEPREVARRALDELCLFLGASQGVVSLFPGGIGRGGELLVARGFSGEQWVEMARFLLDTKTKTLTRWVLENRQSVILDNAHQDPRWYPMAGVDDYVHSVISVPLLGKGQVLGVLNLYSESPRFFDHSHLQLVESVASTIAVALYNAQLFHREQERRRFAEALEEAVAVVNSNLQFDEMMDRILEQVERVIGGDTFNIMLIQKQMVRIVRWRGYEKMIGNIEMPVHPFPVTRYPSLVQMMEEGRSICIPDTRYATSWVTGKGDQWRRSYVGAPIRVAGVTVGFLNANSARPNYFNEGHARRLEAFAEHVAIAIRNARLYQTLQQYTEQLERRVEERTAELLAQYARLNAVLNSTTNGIIVTDAEGRIIQSNPVATRWLTQHFSLKEAKSLRRAIRDLALRAGERPEEVLEFGPVALHLRASPVRGGQGGEHIGHVVIAIDDVSQLKALERMKAQFISNISHELRTPLTAIKLYAQLLRRRWEAQGWEDADARNYLDALEREISHQAALVEEVLNFSRLDGGEATLKLEEVDIVEVVHTVWVEMQVMASAQGLTLAFEADEPIWGKVDVSKVQRAVRNLLLNAIRYTEEGGRVTVAVHPCFFADGREGVCIRVEDTGMGIAEEELPHIFERFYRGEAVQRRQIPGTGLGLAIVKEVVRMHQGRCTVHSEIGQGTAFTLRLPLQPLSGEER